jgi:cytochrome bd ubiquinol oxidase subunit II
VFAALLITELMGSVLMLFFYERTRKNVLQYIVPIWEVTGTFGAYWVVSSYFAYPALLVPIAQLFAGLLIVFLILFVARNSSIVFGEFIIKKGWLDEKKLYRAYAVSTLLLGIVVLIVLSGLVSGRGIDLSSGVFSIGGWVSSAGSLVFVIGTLVIGVGLAPVFYDLTSMKKLALPLTVVGVFVSVAAYYLYSPSLISPLIAVPAILTVLAAVLFSISAKTARVVANKAVFLTLLSVIIFSLQSLIYPNALGKTLSIDSVTINGPVASEFLVLSAAMTVFVGGLLVFYMVMAMRQKAIGGGGH